MITTFFFPVVALELAVIIWLLIRILHEIEELKHHKKHHNPGNLINPF